MKKRIWNKVVSIFTAILLVVGIVPNTTITALAAAEGAPNTPRSRTQWAKDTFTPTFTHFAPLGNSIIML